jgi:splicing factor 3B subunit 3
MATTSSLFMYSLSLQSPTFITHAILGQFAGGRESGNREQQILTASGSRLILYRVDANISKLTKVLEHDVFGTIRQLAAFKVAGAGKGMCSFTHRVTV